MEKIALGSFFPSKIVVGSRIPSLYYQPSISMKSTKLFPVDAIIFFMGESVARIERPLDPENFPILLQIWY